MIFRSVYGQKPGAGRDCGGQGPYVPPNNSQVVMIGFSEGNCLHAYELYYHPEANAEFCVEFYFWAGLSFTS